MATHGFVVMLAACRWCGEVFSALKSHHRQFCGTHCYTASKHQPERERARWRISYHSPFEWRALLQEAMKDFGETAKRGRRVFLVCGETNMKLGLDGLVNIIRYRLSVNTYDGSVYAFCDSTGTNLEYIEWDGSGFCITKRRAQSGSYPWPPAEAGLTMEITEKEFRFLQTNAIVPVGKKRKLKKRKRSKKRIAKKPAKSSTKLQKLLTEKDNEIAHLRQQVQWLTQLFRLMQARQFGASSEKVVAAQLSLFNEVEATADAKVPQPELEQIAYAEKRKRVNGRLILRGYPPSRLCTSYQKASASAPTAAAICTPAAMRVIGGS